MLRKFTVDVGTKFKKGDVRDYPKVTWMQLASNAGKKSIDAISEPVVDAQRSAAATYQKPTKH